MLFCQQPQKASFQACFKCAAVVGIFVSVALLLSGCAGYREAQRLKAMPIEDIHPDCIPDGRYPGSFSYAGFTYRVDVIVFDHRIEEVVVTNIPDDRCARKATAVTQKVIAAQTPDVDAISGAAATSKALLKAIENALLNGGACR